MRATAIPSWLAEWEIGRVTSGSPAPFLKKNIGMAYVPPESASVGAQIEIAIRNHAGAGENCARCQAALLGTLPRSLSSFAV